MIPYGKEQLSRVFDDGSETMGSRNTQRHSFADTNGYHGHSDVIHRLRDGWWAGDRGWRSRRHKLAHPDTVEPPSGRIYRPKTLEVEVIL